MTAFRLQLGTNKLLFWLQNRICTRRVVLYAFLDSETNIEPYGSKLNSKVFKWQLFQKLIEII